MKIFNTVISAVFPNTCAGCGKIIDEGDYICDYCHEMTERCNPDKTCRKCGTFKKKCDCGRFIFHFDGCAAPFVNNGIAKRIMFRFKFRHCEHLSRFFAEQMALTVKQCFGDRKLDCITYVPLTVKKELQRGYNQSYLLAKDLSRILNLPLGVNYLKCKSKRKIQHKISGKERFKNVRGIYSCDISLEGRNILLVDDIKTTGATFDECAKQLFAAGASSVYCIVGLITGKTQKKGKEREKSRKRKLLWQQISE